MSSRTSGESDEPTTDRRGPGRLRPGRHADPRRQLPAVPDLLRPPPGPPPAAPDPAVPPVPVRLPGAVCRGGQGAGDPVVPPRGGGRRRRGPRRLVLRDLGGP